MDAERLERLARGALSEGAFAFLSGGAGDEATVQDNLDAWRRLRLLPRALVDVSSASCGTSILGAPFEAPIGVAPMGFQKLAHPSGELASAGAAAAAGLLMIVSTRTSTPVRDIANVMADRPWWFQVYVLKDRPLTEKLVRRAVDAGCQALVLTADTPLLGTKRGAQSSAGEFDLHLADLEGTPAEATRRADYEGLQQDPATDWSAIRWLQDLSGLPVVVKGILRPDDARRCVDHGASGIIVSNHGGRQLDSAVATATALRGVVEAAGESAEIYVDGGVRSGTDVLKAIALGARAVFVGRPVLWGLAHDGARGVEAVLGALRDELLEAMALAGARSVVDVTSDLVVQGS